MTALLAWVLGLVGGAAMMFTALSLLARRPRIQWNSPDLLPPVDCPLLILANGRTMLAERTKHVAERGQVMEYRLASGRLVTGRLRWTYP